MIRRKFNSSLQTRGNQHSNLQMCSSYKWRKWCWEEAVRQERFQTSKCGVSVDKSLQHRIRGMKGHLDKAYLLCPIGKWSVNWLFDNHPGTLKKPTNQLMESTLMQRAQYAGWRRLLSPAYRAHAAYEVDHDIWCNTTYGRSKSEECCNQAVLPRKKMQTWTF